MSKLNYKYGSRLHTTIKDAVLARYRASERKYQQKHKEWEKSEEENIAYIKQTELDSIREDSREDGRPDYTTIVIPISYAMAMSAHTYLTSTFLGRDPIMQFDGVNGESEEQVLKMESLAAYQLRMGRLKPVYFLWLYDLLKYGVGIIGDYWHEEVKYISSIEDVPMEYNGIPIIGQTNQRKITKRIKGYQGTRGYNIRPYKFHPDPRVPLIRFQDGEFCGRSDQVSWTSIVQGVETGQYNRENVAILKSKIQSKKAASNENWGTSALEYPDRTDEAPIDQTDVGFVDILEMVVNVIPSDWGLGTASHVEKWVFTLAADEVVIGAQPLGEYHDMFPYSVMVLEPEAYALYSRSMFDITRGLQNAMDWLLNSHMFNVRQTMNNTTIVDPSRIVLKDFLKRGPGKVIRAKRTAYGQDVRLAVHQFQNHDVTQNHLKDMQELFRMFQVVTGVNENVMSAVNSGGRKTATEVRQSNTFAISRLKTIAEFASEVGWQPHAQRLVQMTLQHMDAPMKVKIAGANSAMRPGQEQYLDVLPEDIVGMYDFIPVDGTMPIDRYAQFNMWAQLMGQLRNVPQIAQQYDIAGIFAWMAQLGGLKNINRFRVQIAPDEMVGDMAASGRGQGITSRSLSQGNNIEPGQVPGMGATG